MARKHKRRDDDSPDPGSFSRGSDLGPARDRSGNTGGDQYGGGGRSGSMGSPSMPWQGPPDEPPETDERPKKRE